MKRLFLLLLLWSNAALAQHGGAELSIYDHTTHCFYDHYQVVFRSGQTIIDTLETDSRGKVIALNLPVGLVQGELLDNGKSIGSFDVNIQLYQLLQANVFLFDNQGGQTLNGANGKYIGIGADEEPNEPIVMGVTTTRLDLARMPVRSANGVASTVEGVNSVELEECVCTISYRIPLLSKDGSSAMTISRDDIGRVNSQTPFVDYRVGGTVIPPVQLNLGNEMKNAEPKMPAVVTTPAELSVRGGRTDANYYYIDGIKVTGGSRIPNASIESVTVYTGGVPANFGDVTGGVISVRTRSYQMNTSGNNFRKRKLEPVYLEPKLTEDRFPAIYENMFLETKQTPQSTFGIDVDRASWTYVQSVLSSGLILQRDAVKLEEMINSFDYNLPAVPEEKKLDITFQYMNCPWNAENQLVAVRLKAMDYPVQEKRPAHNIVFLVDVSGSMSDPNKLQLLQEGLTHFVQTLNADDKVSLVTYAGSSGVVLPPTLCSNKEQILNAIRQLSSSGSTNGIGGIKTAYQLAEENFLEGGNNRIILATDGDFNVGINNPKELEDYISMQRGKGIYLMALGFGMGNYRNDILETLADRGDGNHFYIRDLKDCEEVLEHNLGNLLNLARDVKLNIEFNPLEVKSYRLIGYENRLMPSEHFRDDSKDGGEIGYGHTVVAVYEIVPETTGNLLKNHYALSKEDYTGKYLCKASLRYKLLEAKSSVEESFLLEKNTPLTENHLLQTVIAFGLELRQSAYRGECDKELLRAMMAGLEGKSDQEKELINALKTYIGK